MSEQLHKTQSLLFESTKDYLELKYSFRAKEREGMAERDQLMCELDKLRDQVTVNTGKRT